jgi:hypothetical protein
VFFVGEIEPNARLLPYVEPAAVAAVDGTRTTVRRFECRRGRRIPEVTLDHRSTNLPTAAASRGAQSARQTSPAKKSTTSQVWRCERCDVSISYMAGHERKGPPAGWETKSGGKSHCLRCRRADAAEMAIEKAPDNTTREERAKIRAAAILDFEILRDPDRPNGEIAKVVRCSVPAVVKSRRRIEELQKK